MDSSPKTIGSLVGGIEHRDEQCEKHGPFVSRGWLFGGRVRWSGCQACSTEQEAARSAEDAERARARDAELARAAIERALEVAAIPARFRDRTFSAFVADTDAQGRAFSAAKAYADEFERHLKAGTGLAFLGPVGTGKTHLAASILLQLAPSYACLYTTASNLVRMVRDTWRKDSERSEREIMRILGRDIQLLVVDELGAQYGSDGERQVLFEVLDRRYAEMRPTIMIGNIEVEGLRDALGDRVYDRMRETHRVVPMAGESYRPKARAA